MSEERLIPLFAELAVEALGRGNLGDLAVDEALGQWEPIFVGECHQGSVVEQRFEDQVEVAEDARIIRLRPLLPNLLQPPLHRVAHLTLADILVTDLRQG